MLISNCTYSHQRASRRPKLTKEHLRKRERWPKNSWAPHRFLWGVKLQNWPVISRDGREKRFPGGCVGSMWYRPPATSAGPGDLSVTLPIPRSAIDIGLPCWRISSRAEGKPTVFVDVPAIHN